MAVVYRALWQASGDGVAERAATEFARWLDAMDGIPDVEVPEEGEVSAGRHPCLSWTPISLLAVRLVGT